MINYKLLTDLIVSMDHITKTRIVKMGSCYARIPATLCKKLNLNKGDEVDIFLDGKNVVFSKAIEVIHARVKEESV
jgi:antitoxin component of MazEF toxin-antitoxin module